MKTLGIDVGTAITGWSVMDFDGNNRSKYKVYEYGAILTDSKMPMPERLRIIYDELNQIIYKHKPKQMAIEDLFFFKNQKTVIKVGQARGVCIVVGMNNNLEVFDYTPLQVKQSITGYGRADKKQMQSMVKTILNLTETPKPDDVADAIAVAICHLNTARY
ncbi:MAG TPA: crossover junction endodeoxyribonuclease RuvC [Candidatus Dojkabacteria bacterium]|jgi:crossover junction endodeoxyribonuclease RuvC